MALDPDQYSSSRTQRCYSLRGAADAPVFVTGHGEGVVRFWEVSETVPDLASCVRTIHTGIDSVIDSLAISVDGEFLFVSDYYRGIRVYTRTSDSPVAVIDKTGLIGLTTGSSSGRFWGWTAKQELWEFRSDGSARLHTHKGSHIAVSEKLATQVISRRDGNHVELTRRSELDGCHMSMKLNTFAITSLAVGDSGTAICLPDGSVAYWVAEQTELILSLHNELPGPATACWYCSTTQRYFIGCYVSDSTCIYRLFVGPELSVGEMIAKGLGHCDRLMNSSIWAFETGSVCRV
jgi:hypothetical protein